MKIAIEITESDIRRLVFDKLKEKSSGFLNDFVGFEVRTTCRCNETWRRPTYLRAVVEKEVDL